MKAAIMHDYGPPDVLRIEDAPRPSPGPAQVLVAVHAASVNPFDCKLRQGWLRGFFPLALPHIPGTDFAGVVAEAGADVTAFKPGDAVWGLAPAVRRGSYAEYLALDAALVRPMPAGIGFAQAAAVPMGAMTAWWAVETLGGLKPGQTLLVHGGAGGVGGYAVQIGKHLGARVVATCGTANVDFVRSLGADEVIDYATQDFSALVRDVDVAVDPLGGEVNLRTYPVMKRGGAIVVVLRGEPVEMQNRARLSEQHGVTVKVVEIDNEPDMLDRARAAIEGGALRSTVQQVLPLDSVAEAHAKVQTGRNRGKLVLQVRADA